VNKINLITPPDKLYNDNLNILLIHPSLEIQNDLQNQILPSLDTSINIYFYDKKIYIKEDVDWLLSVFHLSNIALIDLDNLPSHVKDLASYFIAKSKTYWLTNSVDNVYNHLSPNRIYNLSFLLNLGGSVEKTK
jgi:phosphoribulokinase